MSNIKIFGWNIKTIKSLFDFINKNKEYAIINNITIWANKNGKQPYSVRNYFYKLLKQAKQDVLIYNKLVLNNINLTSILNSSKHQELKDLLYKILDYTTKQSVFKVCLELANNNLVLAKKLNNKYRNALSNNAQLVEEVIKDLHLKGVPTRITFAPTKNIIDMPMQNTKIISDADVQSLVLGVINLIKNNTKQQVYSQSQKDIKTANNNLQKALIDLRRKNVLLEELKNENLKIKQTILKLDKQQQQLKQQRDSSYLTIKELLTSKKQQALVNFVEKLVSASSESSKAE